LYVARKCQHTIALLPQIKGKRLIKPIKDPRTLRRDSWKHWQKAEKPRRLESPASKAGRNPNHFCWDCVLTPKSQIIIFINGSGFLL